MKLKEKFKRMQDDFILELGKGIVLPDGKIVIESEAVKKVLKKWKLFNFTLDDNLILMGKFYIWTTSGTSTVLAIDFVKDFGSKMVKKIERFSKIDHSKELIIYDYGSDPWSRLCILRRNSKLKQLINII
jgi:hypothetical protein